MLFFTKQINPRSPARIMVRQRNRRIHFQTRFFGSFDVPWWERSWIDLFSKETQTPFSGSFGFKNPIMDWIFLKKRTLVERFLMLLFYICTLVPLQFRQKPRASLLKDGAPSVLKIFMTSLALSSLVVERGLGTLSRGRRNNMVQTFASICLMSLALVLPYKNLFDLAKKDGGEKKKKIVVNLLLGGRFLKCKLSWVVLSNNVA